VRTHCQEWQWAIVLGGEISALRRSPRTSGAQASGSARTGPKVLAEEREEPLPGVLRRLLLVDLRPVVREEGMRRAGVEDELDVRVPLPELGLEASHVVRGDTRVGVPVEAQHRHGDAIDEAECVDTGRVPIDPLDMAVPRRRRGDPRTLRRGVQREGAAAAKAGDTQSVRAGPRLPAGEVGGGADIAEVLGARHRARDLTHLGEVLPLHSAFPMVELRRDRVVAGQGEPAHDVLVMLAVPGETGDGDDHRVPPRRLGPRLVGGNGDAADGTRHVASDQAFAVGDDGRAIEIPGVSTPPTVVYAPKRSTSRRLSGLNMCPPGLG
jgi:hypothetical protein